jgi:hypothetical protein
MWAPEPARNPTHTIAGPHSDTAMSRLILNHDPSNGITTYYHYDQATGLSEVWDEQDVDTIIEHNKRSQTADRGRFGDGLGDRVATIPLVVLGELDRQGITRDRKAFARWLNDSDNRFFRTNTIRV